MTFTLTLTTSLRLILALVATAGVLYFLWAQLRNRLGLLQYGVIGLTLITATIHMLSGANNLLLYLNGVGYLLLLTLLYFAPLGPLEIYRRGLYVVFGGYVLITVAAYFVVHPTVPAGGSISDPLAFFTKGVELLLLGLLAADGLRGGQSVSPLPATRVSPSVPATSVTHLNGNGNGKVAAGLPALEVQGLSFSYPDKPDVLRELSFTIRPKERVGLIGPNGAGKTTLFMSLVGIQRPQSGEITIFGRPTKHRDFRPEIGMVFQKSDDQLFSPSVRDDVAFGPQNLGLPPDEVERRVTTAMVTTGVTDLADRPPHHLSGGQKRMVSIAGVMAMEPQLVIYDEPSANLDIRSRRRLIEFMQQTDHAFFVAAHDLEFLLETCDRVILLDEGQIIADGPSAEIMSDDVLMETHGLERPHSLTPHATPSKEIS